MALPISDTTSKSSVEAGSSSDNAAVFLASIEAKLRNPFTSLDLTNNIERESDPRAFLKDVNQNAFDPNTSAKMDKIVKLRILISLLGLEGSTRLSVAAAHPREGALSLKTKDDSIADGDSSTSSEDIIWEILKNAQQAPEDIESWTRMVAGIVQGKMYAKLDRDGDDQQQANNAFVPSRGDEIESLLCKNNEKIIQDTLDSWAATTTSGEKSKVTDEIAFFAPIRYHLLDPPILRDIMPELYTNVHFVTPENCDILQIDPKAEQIRAAEEEKELEGVRLLEEKKILPDNSNHTAEDSSCKVEAAQLAVSPLAAASSSQAPRVSAVPKQPLPLLRSGLGRGRLASGLDGGSAGRSVGGGMSAAAKLALAKRDKSRAAVSSTNTRPASIVTTETTTVVGPEPQTRIAPAGRAMAAMKGRVTVGNTATSSKMKVLELEDVQAMANRNRATESDIETNRAIRKRKLMEQAEARGLRKSTKLAVDNKLADGSASSNANNS